ncbi:hypothetical protein F4560_006440 [Saccharothrix ecbatanensis]|jgi:hypothetical protein|uniref:DUF3311 domain-containing protein n=1 Tax=Saccharothrix ecbatanensis TaxID=1105145 RepID=A0A7W9HQJ9_9PSEU|nr:DUF3311 domain-containing protein [Saccharothrix ecbatanensis]MBB5806672.1 hypothetical protein [Saccharothrix ecbatanensis]
MPSARKSSLRWSNWNLLLLVPLLMLVTPWFNTDEPRLFGLPFFYWFQFAWVPVGVVCVGLVYIKTKDEPVVTGKPDKLGVDDLDEGAK